MTHSTLPLEQELDRHWKLFKGLEDNVLRRMTNLEEIRVVCILIQRIHTTMMERIPISLTRSLPSLSRDKLPSHKWTRQIYYLLSVEMAERL